MHASMPKMVYLEKWFLMGYKHLKTPIGHFIKVAKPFKNKLVKMALLNQFCFDRNDLNQSNIL